MNDGPISEIDRAFSAYNAAQRGGGPDDDENALTKWRAKAEARAVKRRGEGPMPATSPSLRMDGWSVLNAEYAG